MKPVVLAYRSEWTADALPTEKIDFSLLTHIAHSFVLIEQGKLSFPADAASRKLVSAAHRNGVKVTLAIGGAESNKELSALCATEVGTRKLVTAIADQIKKIGYDGADVDWEMPENSTDGERLSRFVRMLREALPRPTLLTMAVSSVDWYGRWFDCPALVPHLDWMAVMSYDFYGPWSDRAGYHAQLFSSRAFPQRPDDLPLTASAAIQYWRDRKKVPANKLLLGIPLYARGFRVKAWGDSMQKPEEVAYRDLKPANVKVDKDAVAAVWTVAAKDGGVSTLLAGDNEETARQKGAWATKNGLPGIFFWELSQDGNSKVTPSLIQAARKGWETGR